ncbi:MAG: tetratricopeptide repeat protein [Burkholderiales bacterium]
MSSSLMRKLGEAQQRLQQGDVAGAQFLCQEVLARAPRNPDALALIGITYLMTGRAHDAIAPLTQALAAAPRHGLALENLGLAYLMLGEFVAAERALRTAAAISGAPASVHMRLGIALLNQQRYTDAMSALQQALALAPDNSDIHLNLGQAAHAAGDPVRARQEFEAALRLSPEHVDAMFNLGVMCLQQNELESARLWFERVTAASPRHADALVNLGVVLETQQRPTEAIASYRRAIAIEPASARARNNLAHALTLMGELEEARAEYIAALRAAPGMEEALEGIASVCMALGRFKEALGHLRELMRAGSERPAVLAIFADVLLELGELDEAESAAKRAIAADPSAGGAYSTLADIYFVRGELDRMTATLQSGVEQTGAIHLLGKLAFQQRRLCDWEHWHTTWNRLAAALPDTLEPVSPFSLLCEPLTAAEQRVYAGRWSERFSATNAACAKPRRTPGKRIRVGYFSSDFYEHATAYLLAEVLELHDRNRFEIFAYSYGPEDHSPMRARLRAACEHFVDIARDPDDVAADRIGGDDLDILIDLKGYTMGARTGVLARRPCAVQVNWLGYPGTMGATFIDYLIADSFIIPPEQESAYHERILRLPHCYQPNDRKRTSSAALSRAQYGLPDRGFIFCGFNQSYKITPEIFGCWMNLLRLTADSVLWLLADNQWATDNLLSATSAAGIEPSRIIFAPKVRLQEHLARYTVADLALDTFPYGSHTTASDALWGGCPLVALCGDTFASRVSGSILTACALPELIARTQENYQQLALRIAENAAYRQQLRKKLAVARERSPLFDSANFTRDLEKLYEDIGAGRI